ncbi:MAG: segregation/condensation protein A [Armatimonadota bacterium]|nr:segregation/condensation protein A [Armatimonadota bacterium]
MSEQRGATPPGHTPVADYTVKVPGFQGPLDLLLTLAHQGKIDLRTVPLAELAGEFLERSRRAMDLNTATEALWMLAALVEMKAKLLLPKPPPPEPLPDTGASDLPERLEEQLSEYRAFREAAEALRALEEFQRRVFVRTPQAEPADLLLEGLTVDDLFQAFQAVLSRVRAERAAEVVDEPVRVSDRKAAILQALRREPRGLEFAQLFAGRVTMVLIVVTFLALLELIKDRAVRVHQTSPLAPIFVTLAR